MAMMPTAESAGRENHADGIQTETPNVVVGRRRRGRLTGQVTAEQPFTVFYQLINLLIYVKGKIQKESKTEISCPLFIPPTARSWPGQSQEPRTASRSPT